jgi:hypothetical protein
MQMDDECSHALLIRVRRFLPDAAQLMDSIRMEWEPEGQWSDWDASVRTAATGLMVEIDKVLNA